MCGSGKSDPQLNSSVLQHPPAPVALMIPGYSVQTQASEPIFLSDGAIPSPAEPVSEVWLLQELSHPWRRHQRVFQQDETLPSPPSPLQSSPAQNSLKLNLNKTRFGQVTPKFEHLIWRLFYPLFLLCCSRCLFSRSSTGWEQEGISLLPERFCQDSPEVQDPNWDLLHPWAGSIPRNSRRAPSPGRQRSTSHEQTPTKIIRQSHGG